MLPSFATQTITVRRAPTVDDHGTSVPDWDAAESHTITGCSVQPISGAEITAGRNAVQAQWRVFAPEGADILATDRVVLPGGTDDYEVVGEPLRWTSPTGLMSHVEILLNRWEG